MQRIILIGLATLLTACANQPSNSTSQQVTNTQTETVSTFYDYQFASPQGETLSLNALPEQLIDADVVLIGEWHTHSAIHRFQTDFLKARHNATSNIALSMEQFTREHQDTLNQYLNGEIGEQVLISKAAAWPNYESDYRALVEFAKANDLDVIAANAPKPFVQCIGRKGLPYLEQLSSEQRDWVATEVNNGDSPYKEKFMASMHHGTPEQTEKQFAAQVTWDETMAESIVDYLASNPNKQVIHVAGKFHTEGGLGTAASILRRNPDLKIAIISPVEEISSDSSDYQLEVLSPPARFVQKENRMKAYKHLSKRSASLECD
ncbi:putative Ferric uptake regulator, CjrA [Vibrio crassostreae]|uniref:Putative Ferric uptake regulator, CjrA n=2 Tax=Vibrio crassostreae TaxID=246167 RepID=A0A822MX83_9VIBR|nr:ChaN family lipoprotein [Vibrio crassostreae]MDH5948518.1 ChaN family lipoprotein [Vibrio crassostreae]TCN07857.1 putative iron-regulated protein [Vibrio crassostreae]TCU12237.1 putative iron-regulated protein [Vibrio crassostreae]CAK2030157.1 putative Ferric uptake regulator, CjrA [Vibrio crassostreae]CAK2031842.1 putative Ferric uptake regulator, CjrA [Vibrio crassostreae]